MPRRIVNETVVVMRNGKRVTPEIGKPFNFTLDEVIAIVGTADEPNHPGALSKIGEDADDDDMNLPEGLKGPSAEGDAGVVEPNAGDKVKTVGKPAAGAQKGKPAADDGDL